MNIYYKHNLNLPYQLYCTSRLYGSDDISIAVSTICPNILTMIKAYV